MFLPMKKIDDPPRLTLVKPAPTGLDPPRPLGPHGRALWDRVVAEFDMGDVGGSELLCLAGQTLDRAEQLAERIRADGVMIRTATGAKAHPCVKDELAARNLTARLLARLGLDLEPLRAGPGRPPGRGACADRNEPLSTAGDPVESTAKRWRGSRSLSLRPRGEE